MKIRKTNVRSSKERTIAFISAFIFIAYAIICFFPVEAEGALVSKRNFLRTSYNPDSYSLFEIQGNMVYARGKYTDDRIRKIFYPLIEDISGVYSLRVKSDGSYEAEFSLPEGFSSTNICVRLNSNGTSGYQIFYENGEWYFPDNGLAKTNRKVFDNIINGSPEAAGYYISATADETEIKETLEQIKFLSDIVTQNCETDYEKARALCRYVATTIYYDLDARKNGVNEETLALKNVLLTARTTCAGFANLYCALLQAQGIDAVNIKGGSTGGDITYERLTEGVRNHEFTAFYYEEEQRWVWVDSCWCGAGEYKDGYYSKNYPHEEFFDITDEALALDHRADYAERRDFFNAKAAVKTAETSAETTEAPETAPITTEITTTEPVTTEKTPDGTAAVSVPPKNSEDNTVLIIIAAVLGLGVVCAGVAVVVNIKK